MRAVPRLCEFYPGICLTTEEKARKNLTQGKKNLNQVKKNLNQSTVYTYILPKHPHTTKPSQTHTLQNPHTHTHTHTHTRYVTSLLCITQHYVNVTERGLARDGAKGK